MFDAEKYLTTVWPLLANGKHDNLPAVVAKAKKSLANRPTSPVTLADHEAAEAEAKRQLDARIDGPDENAPELEDFDEGQEAIDATANIRQWAVDVIVDAKVWEFVAQGLLDFKAAQAKEAVRSGLADTIKRGLAA